MKHAIKTSVVILAALSLVACGGSSKSNKSRRSRITSAVTVDPASAGWEHYQTYTYICAKDATECRASSMKPMHMGDDMIDMDMHRLNEEQYIKYAHCVRNGLDNIDLKSDYSKLSSEKNWTIQNKIYSCCNRFTYLEGMPPTEPITHEVIDGTMDTFQHNNGLSVGEAITNMINKKLYLGQCWKKMGMDPGDMAPDGVIPEGMPPGGMTPGDIGPDGAVPGDIELDGMAY